MSLEQFENHINSHLAREVQDRESGARQVLVQAGKQAEGGVSLVDINELLEQRRPLLEQIPTIEQIKADVTSFVQNIGDRLKALGIVIPPFKIPEPEKQTVRPSPPQENLQEEKPKPTLTFLGDNRIEWLGNVVRVSSNQWQLLEVLARRRQVLSSDLMKEALGGSGVMSSTGRTALHDLRQKLPMPEVNGRRLSLYSFKRDSRNRVLYVVGDIKFQWADEQRRELPSQGAELKKPKKTPEANQRSPISKGTETLILPNGVVVSGLGVLRRQLIEGLMVGSEERPVSRDELMTILYEKELQDPKITKDSLVERLSTNMAWVRATLKKHGIEIVNIIPHQERRLGVQALYYLRPTATEIMVTQQLEEEVPVPPVDQPVDQLVIEIPYAATEQEIRSAAETNILAGIVQQLSASSMIVFEKLQRAWLDPSRIREHTGMRQLQIFGSADLKNFFTEGLRKIREEYQIENERRRWTTEEAELWDKLQKLVNLQFQGNFAEFRKTVCIKLDLSERQFYKTYPPDNGGKVYWLNI